MLVLNRKVGERILIGDNVVVTVVSVQGRQVRIGIEAPASVPVWREELLRGEGALSEALRRAPPAAEAACG